MRREFYPTAIIHCPDCGVECNFVANCLAEMPFSYPGTYRPHQKGSRECLKRQVRNLKTCIKQMLAIERSDKREGLSPPALEEIYHAGWATIVHSAKRGLTKTELVDLQRLQSALEPIQTQVRVCNPYDAILAEIEVTKSEGRRPHPTAFHYQLCWKMRHSSVVRTATSGTLKDLALVYHGLITRQVAVKTLELRVWDRITELYKSIPFPVNWKEVIKDATYGEVTHLKCPVCGNVDLIEENVLGRCELCYAHSGSAPEMEPLEVKSDATRIPATSSQVCTS